MACLVGITTDPDRRYREWKRRYPHLRWEILETCVSKAEANDIKNRWIGKHQCSSAPAAIGEELDVWHVYHCQY